ncbi:PKD domain-containing protein [Patescibacteria group bacterium]|nr:PKD domain-containing protein [Patescibacteria group bacterium]
MSSATVSYWNLKTKKWQPIDVRDTGGSITHDGVGILGADGKCTVSGINVPVGSSRDSSITVTAFSPPADPVQIWLSLNEIDSGAVQYTTQDGLVHWEGDDNLVIIPLPIPIAMAAGAVVCSVEDGNGDKNVSATLSETRVYTFTHSTVPAPTIVRVALDPAGPYEPGQEITILVYMLNGPGDFPPEIDLAGFTVVSHEWEAFHNRWAIVVRCPETEGSYTLWDSVVVVVKIVVPPPPQNEAPTAVLTGTPLAGTVPLTVNFDASGSADSDGSIVEYAWDFNDDGTFDKTGTDSTVSHDYENTGNYIARVRVTDDDGAKDEASVNITVNEPVAEDETFTLFVSGIDGPLTDGQVVHVMQGMGRAIANHWELQGDQGTTVPISLSQVQTTLGELPDWVWDATTGELMTVFWANPEHPNIDDPGNIFITVANWPVTLSVTHGGTNYSISLTLAVDVNPDL